MVACTCSLKPPCLAALLGVGSCPCCAGPHHRHGGIPVRMQYRSTKTPFKTHTSRVRRKRQRLPSNASIRTDAAIRFPPALSGLLRRVTSDRMLEFCVWLLPILLGERPVADAESAGLQDAVDLLDQGMQCVRLLDEACDIGAGEPLHSGLLPETRGDDHGHLGAYR